MTRYILLSDSYSTYLRDVAAGENSEEARRVGTDLSGGEA